jgi:hypothetical protein
MAQPWEVLGRHGALRSLGEAGRVCTKFWGNKMINHAATLTAARIRATMTPELLSQAHSLHVFGVALCRAINKPNQGELCYES